MQNRGGGHLQNNKGFAISGIIYSILILFLLLVFSILAILGSRKLIIDRFKLEVLNKIYGNELEKEKKVYKDNSGANSPELLNNMIPIKYDGSNWIYADIKEEWYDYDKKEWANAVVLNSDVNKNVGDTIAETDIALWYVWIPRYTYTVFNGNNGSVDPLEIQIKFENGTNSNGTVECVDTVSGSGTSSEVCTDSTNGSVINNVSTYTHPAFTFGGQELTGFWVGKFEISGSTSQITIKPNVSSLRNNNLATFFTAIQNMNTIYSLNGDSHVIKNMEWGAVAYLSHSKYGTCTNGECVEVGTNNNSSYTTGCGATTKSSASSICNEYNSKIGVLASTTQTVYGIYDMNGGAYELVMGNMVSNSGNFNSNSSGFTNVIDEKYYDDYTYSYDYRIYQLGKLGDATKESLKEFGSHVGGGWYDEYVDFPYNGYFWFLRSGYYYNTSISGIFCYHVTLANADSSYSTRAILVSNN